jgi:hypothetical protein
MIAHHPQGLEYTGGIDWCAEYAQYAIPTCAEQYNRIDTESFIFWVVAAFQEDKVWCGTEFGFGDYNADVVYFAEYGACLLDALEIPTSGWPGPMEGTAVVATTTTWAGNFIPVYYFGGYTYCYYYGETMVPLGVDPSQNFGGFGNCLAPPVTYDAEMGGMGVCMDGLYVCPPPPGEEMVCCFPDGSCIVMLEEDCMAAGGAWRPDLGNSCDPNLCPPPPPEGACCDDQAICVVLTEEGCMLTGGMWLGPDTVCEPNPCEDVCCDPATAECMVTTMDACVEMGWDWHPEFDSCDPNECQVPTSEPTWGSIKAIYR